MTLPYAVTKNLIDRVLKWDESVARERLYLALVQMGHTEGEFYAGIVQHGNAILFSAQWFNLLRRLPNRMLRSQLDLENILSQEQIKNLPPSVG
jgi:hypothetical protein